MEYYPSNYLKQPVPLVTIQGLGSTRFANGISDSVYSSESTELVQRALPNVDPSFGDQLVDIFKQYDEKSGRVWVSEFNKTNFDTETLVYKINFVDEFRLPKHSGGIGSESTDLKNPNKAKSPLSVFNPSSSIYPSGILHESWITKYTDMIPSLYISIHKMTVPSEEKNVTEQICLKHDEEIVKEILTIKSQLDRHGIRLLEIIVSDEPQKQKLAVRINNMRTATGLAPRTGLLLLPKGTAKEYSIFVNNVLHLIKPWCFDFYINLAKKLRKKRVTPPEDFTEFEYSDRDGSIKGYSLVQWDARYAVKLAFANLFHQNNDMSIKNLDSAYDSLALLATKIPIEVGYNNKNCCFLWHQTRKLLDIVAFCIVKEYLYLEMANRAYRRFENHLQTIFQILKHKKIQMQSYSVHNWLSVQFELLGELCNLADEYIVPIEKPFSIDPTQSSNGLSMQQPGFIFLQAINYLRSAKELALDSMPSENSKLTLEKEISISDSKAFEVLFSEDVLMTSSSDTELIDSYLSLPLEKFMKFPFHQKSIVLLQEALAAFNKTNDINFVRTVTYLRFQLAEENYELKNYNKAIDYYEDCINLYKQENWKSLLTIVLMKLIKCLIYCKKWTAALLYIFELSINSDVFIPSDLIKSVNPNRFLRAIDAKDQTVINLFPEDAAAHAPNLFTGLFLFKFPVLAVSKSCEMQLSVKSLLNSFVFKNVTVSSITISFKGHFSAIKLTHNESLEKNFINVIKKFESSTDGSVQIAQANLNFESQEVKVFQFTQKATKIEKLSVSSIVIEVNHEKFSLKYNLPVSAKLANDKYLDSKNNSAKVTPDNVDVNSKYYVNNMPDTKFFWMKSKLSKHLIKTEDPFQCIIIPRRPETVVINQEPQNAFSDEIYELKVYVKNKDSEDIGVILRPSIKMLDNNNGTSNHLTRPSSKVSSRVTSPRNSLDLRPSSGGSLNPENFLKELSWNDRKTISGENHDLKLVSVGKNSEETHSLYIKIPKVVNKYLLIKIECSFFTGEDIALQQESEEKNKSLSTRDTLNIRVPIVVPFVFTFATAPRLRSDDLASPFVFNPEDEFSNNAFIKVRRTWAAKLGVKLFGNAEIELSEIKLVLSSINNEYKVETIDGLKDDSINLEDLLLKNDGHSQSVYHLERVFRTFKVTGQSYVQVPIKAVATVKWKRKNGELNVTESPIWNLSLSQFEPRVTFEVGKLKKEKESPDKANGTDDTKTFIFKYTIENPSPRIFTFSTFIESNEYFEISGYNKDISQLPVLPFTRQELKFKAEPKNTGKLKIPHLKVYDLQYKVTLAVIPASNEVVSDKNDIYIRV